MTIPIVTRTFRPFEFYKWVEKWDREVPGNEEFKASRTGALFFTGTATFAEAKRLATTGWAAGTEKARKMAQLLSEEMVASLKRPEIVFDVTGDMFDMGRVVEDTPECWMQWQPGQEESHTGPICIVLNCTVSGGIDTKTIEQRGAAACALAIIFEAAGRPTRIEVCAPNRTNTSDGYQTKILEPRVVLKDYYEDIQIDAVAFALIHPSFFRRYCFGAYEMWGMNVFGYGNVIDTPGNKGDIYIGQAMYGDAQWTNEAATLVWLREQLDLQGVKMK